MNVRNKTLDAYKGILIILVVVRHVLQYSISDEGGILTNIIWAVQMPGFMLVAGFFSFHELKGDKAIFSRLIKSVQHYALPFFSWFILVSTLLLGNYNRSIKEGLKNLTTHIDSELWFLWVVFVLSLFVTGYNYIYFTEKNKMLMYFKMLIVTIVIYGLLVLISKNNGISFLGIKYILYYSLFYFIGWIVRINSHYFERFKNAIKLLMIPCLIIFISIIANYDLYHSDDNLISIFLRFIAGITGNLIILGIVKMLIDKLMILKIDKLGMYTLETYCTHIYIVNHPIMTSTKKLLSYEGSMTFIISLIYTVGLTYIIILIIKSIPILNFIMFGKSIKSVSTQQTIS